MCIESGVFCDAGSGLTRWGFGPMPFGLARPEKRPEDCAWAADQARWTTVARPSGTAGPALPGRRLDCSSLRNPPQVALDAAAPCAVDVRVPQVQIEVEVVVAVLGEQPHLYRLI